MKMKEFGPPGGGRASLAPPLGSANGTTKLLDIILKKDQEYVTHFFGKFARKESHLKYKFLRGINASAIA